MTKRFKVPFAVQGDTAQIPDTAQADGKVSYNQGFGHDYEKAYSDPQAKDIGREQLNGLFKDITEAVGEIQLQGVASHVSGETYPKGSIVYFGSDLYISNIANNKDAPPKNWTSIKSIADDSLKKNSNLSDLKDVVIARKNLELGDAATLGKTSALGNSEALLLTQLGGNNINIAAVNAQKSANAANDKANQAKQEAYEADQKAVAAQNKANQVPNPVKDQFLIGNTATGYKLITKDQLITLLAIPSATNVVNETGNSATSAISQKAFTDLSFGINQQWEDVTSQRTSVTTYTNNTDNTIFIVIDTGGNTSAVVYVNDIRACFIANYGVYLPVPAGATYRLTAADTIQYWGELR